MLRTKVGLVSLETGFRYGGKQDCEYLLSNLRKSKSTVGGPYAIFPTKPIICLGMKVSSVHAITQTHLSYITLTSRPRVIMATNSAF